MGDDSRAESKGVKIGLALAGGGPVGAIYEIGALRALDEATEGLDLNSLHCYVGVSAGSFIAANLANKLSTAQMCRAIVKQEPGEHPFVPETFFTPALGEFAKRAGMVPGLLMEAIGSYLRNPLDQTLLESLTLLARALPVGAFDPGPIRDYLHGIYTIRGRTDDFRALDACLIVVAADLDSGSAVRFGEPGMDHIPISQAVQASGALPGLYPPVKIEGRHYVDGVLLKTMHASVALDRGVDLLICLNPIVPVDTAAAVERGVMKRGKLVDRGLFTVLDQSLRTIIRSRFQAGMRTYDSVFNDKDVVLIEPRRDDYKMFFTNVFSFDSRRTTCEHAYRSTLIDLAARREQLRPIFAANGIHLRDEVLDDPDRDMWVGVGLSSPRLRHPSMIDLHAALDRIEGAVDQKLHSVN